jgi:hypothetical protein
VQSNDARVLLTELGDFEWSGNVAQVIKRVLTELLTLGHSILLDGGFIDDAAQAAREGLIQRFSLKPLLIAVDAPLEKAERRARQRYADGQSSRFGDWRANDLEAYVQSMEERQKSLHGLFRHRQDVRFIMNDGDIDQLDWKVRQISAKF